MAGILEMTNCDFPFSWANLEAYRESLANRKEIYLNVEENAPENLILLFYHLFGDFIDDLQIFNRSWWDFCLDTWDFDRDEYNYDINNVSQETKVYLDILTESKLPIGYQGCCVCKDWNRFLLAVLRCVVSHKAPYSPLFFVPQDQYFFYFHHTASIGIYNREENDAIFRVLSKSYESYTVVD